MNTTEEANMQKRCCGNCKYHKHDNIEDDWLCTNPASDYVSDWTDYSDYCEDYEEKDSR